MKLYVDFERPYNVVEKTIVEETVHQIGFKRCSDSG